MSDYEAKMAAAIKQHRPGAAAASPVETPKMSDYEAKMAAAIKQYRPGAAAGSPAQPSNSQVVQTRVSPDEANTTTSVDQGGDTQYPNINDFGYTAQPQPRTRPKIRSDMPPQALEGYRQSFRKLVSGPAMTAFINENGYLVLEEMFDEALIEVHGLTKFTIQTPFEQNPTADQEYDKDDSAPGPESTATAVGEGAAAVDDNKKTDIQQKNKSKAAVTDAEFYRIEMKESKPTAAPAKEN